MARKPRLPTPEYEEFAYRIGRASLSYGLMLNRPQERECYWEHFGIEVEAVCLWPDRFAQRAVKVHLSAHRDFDLQRNWSSRADQNPRGVGFMKANKSVFELTCIAPADVCWGLNLAIASGTAAALLTNGPRLRRSDALITSYSFYGPEFSVAEYIG